VFSLLKNLFKRDDIGDRLQRAEGTEVETTAEEEEKKSTYEQAVSGVESKVVKSEGGSTIARKLASADLKLRVVEFMGLRALSAVAGSALGAYLGRADPIAQVVVGLVVAFAASFIPNLYVNMRANGRVKTFNDQLGDTITMMANSLRGGYNFLQAMKLVGQEAPPPTNAEFARVVQEVGLGRPTKDALENLLRRMPSEDLDLMITAVNIQHEVGGNLATILDSIGHTIRERVRIKGEIKPLTAQGRLSGYVITGLPIAMGAYISFVNPDYMAPLFKFGMPPEAWCCLPLTALFFIAVGFVVMMKIVDIEV
jgi:tight adherence protein B